MALGLLAISFFKKLDSVRLFHTKEPVIVLLKAILVLYIVGVFLNVTSTFYIDPLESNRYGVVIAKGGIVSNIWYKEPKPRKPWERVMRQDRQGMARKSFNIKTKDGSDVGANFLVNYEILTEDPSKLYPKLNSKQAKSNKKNTLINNYLQTTLEPLVSEVFQNYDAKDVLAEQEAILSTLKDKLNKKGNGIVLVCEITIDGIQFY